MKDLRSLIRLHKLEVDERRRALADLQALEERMVAERQALDAQLAAEQQVAGQGSLLVASTFPAFLRQMRSRRDAMDRDIAHLRGRIAAAEQAVADAFQELKRYEVAQEERDRRLAEERKRRETQMFDEIASTRFQRQAASGEGGGDPA